MNVGIYQKNINELIWHLHNTVAPKISLRWYKLLPSAILAQDASVDQNKTLSNSHSLISFKTIKISSNFALTVVIEAFLGHATLKKLKKSKLLASGRFRVTGIFFT